MLVSAQAIRIDEAQLTVYGLTDGPDLQLRLNPVGAPELYLQRLRSYISTSVLGSPRHFPTHLRRWAGLRQFSNAPLEKLLLLGDPEAVYAVACSPRLTEPLARAVWWSCPAADTARQLLRHPVVAASALGSEIARWLFEYLPFESETSAALEAVQLLLQPDLLDAATRTQLWNMGRRRKTYRIAFLAACPLILPVPSMPRVSDQAASETLTRLARAGDACARLLQQSYSAGGQAFIATALDVMTGISTQDEATVLFNSVCAFFPLKPVSTSASNSVEELRARSDAAAAVHPVTVETPMLRNEVSAVLFAGQYSDALLTPVFARSDAVGTVLRKQIEPLTAPLAAALRLLLRETIRPSGSRTQDMQGK